eukprot:jgi/Hompol1/4406/HPOL_007086-RA
MGDNAVQVALWLCAQSSILPSIDLAPATSIRPGSTLPVPNFAFFDVFGAIGVIQPSVVIIASSCVVLVITIAFALFGTYVTINEITAKNLYPRMLAPLLQAYGFVWLSFFSAIVIAAVVSAIKHLINRAATYGRPELAIAYTVPLTLGIFSLVMTIWDVVAARYKRPFGLGDASQTLTAFGPPLQSWVMFGLLGFWCTMLFLHLVFSAIGITALYFLFETALLSAIACGVIILVDSSLGELFWRSKRNPLTELLRSSCFVIPAEWYGPKPEPYLTRSHPAKTVWRHLLNFWLIEFLLAALVPVVMLVDVLHLFYNGIPSLI